MSVILASTWHPRGELPRLMKVYPILQNTYTHIVITLPPDTDLALVSNLGGLGNTSTLINQDWSWGRYAALQKAIEIPTSHVQYADLDRLVRWVETQPDELRRIVELIKQGDCTIIGRTEKAWSTHPQALRYTETLYNRFFSHLLGQPLDISAGSKGFSQRAVQFLMANSKPGRAYGTDAEWPVLLHRAGFRLQSVLVDGLDWESADRYEQQAANPAAQRRAAEVYDAEARNWEMRLRVAMEVVECGLDALTRPLIIASH